jgi:RNA polymerase sigma-70 factor, ECF subfamily
MTPLLAQRLSMDRAFERLYRQNVRQVYRYALAVLPTPEDAEDVTQTTFLNAYSARARGECPHSPETWLIAIAHELCRQRTYRDDEIPFAEQAEQALPDEEGPTADDVRRALGCLPYEQRAALIMREVEERPYAEIAQILEASPAAVETLTFRARRALREELEGALTCHEAEHAISRNLDGLLDRAGKRVLRRHLRECGECKRFDRGQRAQRTALRALANVALPRSLSSFFDCCAPESSPGRA